MNGLKEGVDYTIHPIGGTAMRLQRPAGRTRQYKAAMLNPPFSIDARPRA